MFMEENLTVSEIAAKIRKKEFSPKEIAAFYLKKIRERNPDLNAFITVNEAVLEEAESLPKRFRNKEKGPLYGVPLSLKDMFCTAGLRTTAASRTLKDFIPPYSATVAERLKDAGALLLGKCNNDEFAMGSSGETSYFGPAKNPWDGGRSPGGSSSGSASAVAGGLAPASIGTDTGGSVRLPAHFCGLTGVKPTYGRVSRYGMIAHGSSLDQAGPLAKTAEDSALILDAVTGRDPKDSTSAPLPPSRFHKNLSRDIRSMRIAWFPIEKTFSFVSGSGEIIRGAVQEETAAAQQKALQTFEKTGCRLIKAEAPLFQYGAPVYYLISASEASANLSRYDGLRYGSQSASALRSETIKEFYETNRTENFGEEVKRRILMGAFCLSRGSYQGYFEKACRVRRLIKRGFEEIFKSADIVLSPTAFSAAFRAGEAKSSLEKYMSDQFTTAANLTGFPALTAPVCFSKDNLPVGVQLTAPAFEEQRILDAAFFLEKELHENRPPSPPAPRTSPS